MMTNMDSNGAICAILESMEISSLNKLPPHTPLSNDKQLLNGDWEFVGYEDVEEIPWPQLFDGQMPRTMPVPANWELHGFGSPRYINTRYTFEPDANLLHPPYIPAGQNPVGVYARTFNHQAQAGFRDILAFNGFEGALFVYLNHQFVGYASNGRSVSEFDITELVHSGENQLHLVLAAFSAGSWLECQDMWRLKGINRDVYLTQVPERRIFDHYTHFDLDRSRLHIDAKILNDTPVVSDPLYLSASILDPQGQPLQLTDDESQGFTGNLSPHYEEKRFAVAPESLQANTMGTIYLDLEIPAAQLWSPEHPQLYTITLTLRDTAGHTLDSTCYAFGLRSIEIRGPELLLNGASIKLRGVKHHEFHPDSGHVVTPDREPTPKLAELKQVHQQVSFSLVTPTTTSPRIRLTNDYAFTDLSHFTLSWQILADGHPLASGTLDDLTCPPQASYELTLPCTFDSSFISGEILLDISLRLRHSTPWAQAGHELAFAQLPLPSSATHAAPAELAHPSSVHSTQTVESLTLTIADIELQFSRTTGLLTRYAQTHDSGPGIRDLRFQVWRAPTDNDRLAQASHREALPTSAGAYVSLDARQSGLGNKSCGPETLPQYLVQPLPAHFVFSLHPGGQAETMRADITDLLELSEQITEHSGPLSEAPAERSTYQDPSDPDARAAIGMEP